MISGNKMKGILSESLFSTVIENTPLVSIDLIVENPSGQILLGQRLNKPAKSFWFVPGGRILKSETMECAFSRLTLNELNKIIPIENACLQGAYEHFYQDSFVDDNISTHYVVLAYKIKENIDINILPDEQHRHYKWFDKNELLSSDAVHFYTKNYFQDRK